MAPSSSRTAGWDPWLLISQIVSMQSFRYLALCVLIPPLLMIFAEPHALEYEGGAFQVSAIMDWREMSSRPTVYGLRGENHRGWHGFTGAHGGENKTDVGYSLGKGPEGAWNDRTDPIRGWCIGLSWLVASVADVYYLYTFVRRPRLILDFSITLVLNHLILTTYYSAALPSSLFFWFVIISSTCLTVVCAEQLCVRREMREGLGIGPWNTHSTDGNSRGGEADAMELGQLRRD